MTVLKRDIVRMWNDLWNTFPQNVASLPHIESFKAPPDSIYSYGLS